MHIMVWWGNMKDKDGLEDVVVEGTTILKKICKKQDGRAWTGLIWLRRGTSGALLQARQLNFGFHNNNNNNNNNNVYQGLGVFPVP